MQLSSKTKTATIRGNETIFYIPGYQFAIRLILGATAGIYFYFMPLPLMLLTGWQVFILFFIYFCFHTVWWFRFSKKGMTFTGIRMANWVDMFAGGMAVVVDPFRIPPGLLLILIAVLGNGIQHGMKNFYGVSRNAVFVSAAAIPIHFYLLGRWPPYDFYFFICFLLAGVFYSYALVRRIEELKNHAESLAQTDELTGLMNRRAFMKSARYLISLYHRSRLPLVFIYTDLDGFKAINDSLGHDIGDQVLKGFADLAKLNFRQTDLVSRYGGDEFVFILTDSSIANAEKVMQRVESQFKNWGRSLGLAVGISWGMAAAEGDRVHIDDMIRAADQKLYAAKRRKREARQGGDSNENLPGLNENSRSGPVR